MSTKPTPQFTFEEMKVIWTALYRFDGDTAAYRGALQKANEWLTGVGKAQR